MIKQITVACLISLLIIGVLSFTMWAGFASDEAYYKELEETYEAWNKAHNSNLTYREWLILKKQDLLPQ